MWKSNRRLIGFILISYLDKLLTFILPITVLYIANNEIEYNDVEYICSIANIVVPFLTFLSIYSFYGYKETKQKEEFVNSYKLYISFTVIVITVIALVIVITKDVIECKGINCIGLCVVIRIAFYTFIQYFNSYYRLMDKPIYALIYPIFINIISAIAILGAVRLGSSTVIVAFFVPEIVTIIVVIYYVLKNKRNFRFKHYFCFLAEAAKFSWPIVLNCTVVAFVANYGKIYAYNFLSEYEMYCLSFLLRIVLVIQMSHSSLISFFSKDIYIHGFTKKFFVVYSAVMSMSLVAFVGILIIYNSFLTSKPITIDCSCGLIVLYTILHMVGTIFEVDYSRNNRNIYIFGYSVVSCVIFIFLVFGVGIMNLTSLALYMVVYMFTYVLMLFLGKNGKETYKSKKG